MSGPEINMDLKTLTANYCHSTAGGNTYTMSARLLSSPVFADPGRVWSCNINCGTCLTFQGPAGAGPWDQLCHIVMDPVRGQWDTIARAAAARTMVQECRVIKQMVPNHPVQLQVVEPLWVPSWLNAPGYWYVRLWVGGGLWEGEVCWQGRAPGRPTLPAPPPLPPPTPSTARTLPWLTKYRSHSI